MAQLDRIIKILHQRRGESMTLVSGKQICLAIGGATRAVSGEAQSDSQVLGLMRDLAPADVRDRVAP